MGAFYCLQPNGLYCRFSTVLDCPTDYNLTVYDIVSKCVRDTIRDVKDMIENGLEPFEEIQENFAPINMSVEQFKDILTKMGLPVSETDTDNQNIHIKF